MNITVVRNKNTYEIEKFSLESLGSGELVELGQFTKIQKVNEHIITEDIINILK